MEMTRSPLNRASLAILLILAMSGCVPAGSKSSRSSARATVVLEDAPRREGVDAVLVVTPFTADTLALWTAMRDEISEDLDVVTMEMHGSVTAEQLAAKISTVSPRCLVLINNATVRMFRQLQATGSRTPPAVVLMSSFAEEILDGLTNTTGIAYEVPGVTSFVTLRSLTGAAVKRVGVVHQASFEGFISKQARLAQIEKVELISEAIDGKVNYRSIKRALKSLTSEGEVDAIWVLNDNALLTSETITKAWLPSLRGTSLPVIVGVPTLVRSDLQFGTIAVLPDHSAMGVQAGNVLFELADEDWEMGDRGVEQPVSIETVVDMSQLGKRLQLVQGAADQIDRKVE